MKPNRQFKSVFTFIFFLLLFASGYGQSITVTGALTQFSSCSGIASSAQNLSVSGSSLTGNVVVTAPAGYEISNMMYGTFTSSLTLTPNTGSLTMTMVYVRLSSTATNGASGNVEFTSPGATTRTVATQNAVLSLPEISITQSGSAVSNGCVNKTYVFTGSRDPNMMSA